MSHIVGRFLAVGLAAGEVAQERPLAGAARALVDRRVLQRPVDRQAEPAQQRLEDLLVGLDQLVAELEEVRPARWRRRGDSSAVRRGTAAEPLDVRLARIAAHAVVVLDAPLGGQAVVVPTHRVEDLLAGHALVAGDRVGVGVAEHVAHVQRAADGGRRRVDREHVGPLGGAVEARRSGRLPIPRPSAPRCHRASAGPGCSPFIRGYRPTSACQISVCVGIAADRSAAIPTQTAAGRARSGSIQLAGARDGGGS